MQHLHEPATRIGDHREPVDTCGGDGRVRAPPVPGTSAAVKFRERALTKLGDAEQLDIPVRLTRPRTWVAVVAVVALVMGGVAFLVTGSLPRTFQVAGVLTAAPGNFRIQTPQQGQVTAVYVRPGSGFVAQQPVVRLRVGARSLDVVAAEPGRVLSVLAVVGQVLPAGGAVAVAARAGRPGDRQVAVLFAPVSDAFRVSTGARVDVTVDSAPSGSFGVLTGRVVSVARTSDDLRQLSLFLGTDDAPAGVVAGTRMHRVTVELEEADTRSGYRWSTSSGPPGAIESGVSVIGTVHETPVRPISWLLP